RVLTGLLVTRVLGGGRAAGGVDGLAGLAPVQAGEGAAVPLEGRDDVAPVLGRRVVRVVGVGRVGGEVEHRAGVARVVVAALAEAAVGRAHRDGDHGVGVGHRAGGVADRDLQVAALRGGAGHAGAEARGGEHEPGGGDDDAGSAGAGGAGGAGHDGCS